jgi:CubicO group peptidase (beta-lactamase class C family)
MTSGLDVVEDNSGADPVSRFLYTEPDVTSAFRQAKLRATPGTEWAYTSANTWALSRIVEDATGGSPASLITWARARIFSPIGMDDVVLEFDAKGTPLGSSYSLATARDWARLGWLYANGGRVGTTQIIPATWPDWVATPTAGASKGYGAGFWTNRGDTPGARQRVAWGMPPDSYFALGFLGQYTVIIPSRRLVIVRIGDDHVADEDGRRIDSQGISRFVGAVVQHFDRAASP